MKKNKYLLILWVLLFAALSAFAEKTNFKVGFTVPLTGPFAEFGVAVKNALELTKQEQPQLMDQLEFILEDDQYNPKSALSAFKKLKDVDGADLIMVWGNEPALSVAPVAESAKFPILAFGQTAAIAAKRKHVLRVLGPAAEFGKPLAEYLNARGNIAVEMILVENTFYKLVSDSVQENLSSTSSFKELASVPASEFDFKPYLLKAKQHPAHYLGVFLAPGQLVPFFKQAKDLGINNPIFGSTAFESKAIVSEAKHLLSDAVYAHVTVDSSWHKKYYETFGDDIQVSYAAVAHDIFLAIAKTVADQQEAASGASVLEALAKLPAQNGAAGKFFSTVSAQDGRYIDFQVTLKRVTD